MTLNITFFSTTPLGISGTQHNNIILNVIMLSFAFIVVMQNVVMLSVVMLSVIVLSVVAPI
jgi:hypothetical protein